MPRYRHSTLASFGLPWLALLLLLCGTARLALAASPAATLSNTLPQSGLNLQPPAPDARTLYFLGFASHDESPAFMGDTALAAQRMRELTPEARLIQLANPPAGQAPAVPLATTANLARSLEDLGTVLSQKDVVVILVSTHGAPGRLAVQVGGEEQAALSGRRLQRLLAPLGTTPTVLILSACYSGSLLPALRAPNRLILTAAAANRASFGCGTDDTNTFFIDELLRNGFSDRENLLQAFERTRVQVAEREKRMNLTPPSQPQLYIGSAMRDFAALPLKDWLAPDTLPPLPR